MALRDPADELPEMRQQRLPPQRTDQSQGHEASDSSGERRQGAKRFWWPIVLASILLLLLATVLAIRSSQTDRPLKRFRTSSVELHPVPDRHGLEALLGGQAQGIGARRFAEEPRERRQSDHEHQPPT